MGFAGVHAIPMRLRDQVIGTLNLFRAAPDGLEPAVARAARALVDVATIGILQERAVARAGGRGRAAAGRAEQPGDHRAGQGHPGRAAPDDPRRAFLLLRRYARDHNHPLTQLAGDVIRGTAPIIHGT